MLSIKNFLIFIVIFSFTTCLSYHSVSAQESLTVFTDKTSYNYGDSYTISGNVNPVSQYDNVSIEILTPNNPNPGWIYVSPNPDGKYSYTLQLGNKDTPLGTFTIIAYYQGVQEQTTFSYGGPPPEQPMPQTISPPSQTQTQQSNIIPQWVRNNANWWATGQIGDSDFIKGIQYLIDNNILQVSNQDELNKLKEEVQNLQTQLQQGQQQIQQLQSQSSQSQQYTNGLEEQLRQAQTTIATQQSQPTTIISNGTVHWYFSDSKGYKYSWEVPIQTYDFDVMANSFASRFIPSQNLQLPNGGVINTYDYSGIAKILSERKEWSAVVDALYNNAGSDDQFIYEVWHMVAELTTYNKDITNTNLLPVEVLTRGEGDCKDKAILIADLLRSSSHTTNWKINLEIMDSDNPDNPQTVNHMIVLVNTGQNNYAIEATAQPDVNGMNVWAGKKVVGWDVPF
jgi:hypothetical protein